MTKTARPQSDPAVIAVLHRTQRVWRCLVARLAGASNGSGEQSPPLSIIDQREFTLDQANRIDGWLDSHKVARAIVVLPSSSVICRTCPLPQAEPEQMDAALRLQAESHLLGQSPAHRTAMAVLHPAAGETTRCGLVLAWPANAAAEIPPLNRPVTFAPDVAALAALLDGERPTEALLWADRRNGSVALALTHANGAAFRCTRENGDWAGAGGAEAWSVNIGRIVGETAIGAGHSGPFVESMVSQVRAALAGMERDGSLLLLPAELVSAINRKLGRNESPTWWSNWGIAAGAALAATDQLAPLTQLQDQAPIETPSVLDRAVTTLSNRRFAAIAAAVCLAVLLLSPLLFSGARLLILDMKLPEAEKHRHQLEAAEARLVVYEELRQRTWSMTKVLADLACSMPEGIEVLSINITGGEIRISGSTEKGPRTAQENLLLMEKQMRDSGVFEGIRVNWGKADKFGNYEFDLFAKVKDPYRVVSYSAEQDYGARTLRDRRYPKPTTTPADPGEAAAAVVPPSHSPTDADHDGALPDQSPTLADAEPTINGEDDPARSARLRPSPGIPSPGDAMRRGDIDQIPLDSMAVPPPLAQAEIDAMDKSQAREASGRIAKLLRRASLSEEDRARLDREFKQIMQHMRSLK